MDTNTERFDCSEIYAKAIEEQGYKCEKEPALMTPQDCLKFEFLEEEIEII